MEEADEARYDAGFDHPADLLVGSVRDVTESPAGVTASWTGGGRGVGGGGFTAVCKLGF